MNAIVVRQIAHRSSSPDPNQSGQYSIHAKFSALPHVLLCLGKMHPTKVEIWFVRYSPRRLPGADV